MQALYLPASNTSPAGNEPQSYKGKAMGSCVIVGASHAAAQLVVSLRQQGWEGEIVLVGDEPHLPYHRPPLSKTFLSGDKGLEDILIRPASAYEKANVTLRLGQRVTALNSVDKTLTIDNGDVIHFEKLVLATGSRARQISLPGADKAGVFYLRNVGDVNGIRALIGTGKRAVIIGGGYIGLESAAAMRAMGMEVTVLEAMSRVLQRITAPEISAFYQRIHTEEGVNVQTDVVIRSIEGDASVTGVQCEDGLFYPADVVIVGIGIVPNIELAESAGIQIENGIVVNEYCESSHPDILAVGDCTYHFNPIYGRQLRLESVQNAVDQAKVAAATVAGKREPYAALPWFWSDQYNLKLQIAGLSQGFDQVVVRGDINNSRKFAAFYLQAGKLLAVDAINSPLEFMLGKRLLTLGISPDPSVLADTDFDLKSLLG